MISDDALMQKAGSKIPFIAVTLLAILSIIGATFLDMYYDLDILLEMEEWDYKDTLVTVATFGLIILISYYLVGRRHYERVSALLCIISATYIIKNYLTVMTYGDFILFIEAFFIILMSVMQIAFSIDLYKGMRESAAIIKTVMLINIVFIVILKSYDYVRFGEYYEGFYSILMGFSILPITASIFSYMSLYSQGVLGGHRVRMSELPRIPILSGIMMLYGLIYLFDLQPAVASADTGFELLTNILFIAVGLFFLLYRDVDILSSVSIMLIVIGFSSIIRAVPEILSTDSVNMLLGIVMGLAGFACIILCALMYSGDKINTRRLQIIMLVLFAASVIPIIFESRIHPDPEYLVYSQSNRFLTAVLVGGTFVALTDRSIKYSGIKERMAFDVHTMNNTICNDASAIISRPELYKLYGDGGWTVLDGPVEREKTVKAYINGCEYPFTVRKWRGSGKLTGEVHSSNDGTYIQALRFDINKVIMDDTIEECRTVTIYGEKGFFIRIPVADEEMNIETNPLFKIFFMIIGHKNTKKVKVKFDKNQ